jgi:endoglucanase
MVTQERTRFRLRHAVIAAVLILLAVLGAALASMSGERATPTDGAARNAATTFLNAYVESDGRVVRHDQGGDTVSEGQAYAMLLAETTGDQGRFAQIWSWTRTHLQERNGLFAFRTDAAGKIADPQPAADADVLIAWALMRATGPDASEYHLEGRRVANAVLARETTRRGSSLMLAAGPWAVGAPVTLDPSYWAPVAFEQLAQMTGDLRWQQLDDSTLDLSTTLTAGGTVLPPDWARVDGTKVSGTESPNKDAHFVQYGLDAQRLVVWLATGCSPSARRLAARLNSVLTDREDAIALTPDGVVIDQQTNAVPLVAAAAAAQAAGDDARRDQLLAKAAQVNRATPTYYGSAWIALGTTLLETKDFGGCTGR